MGKRLVLREAVEAIQGQGLLVVCEAVVCEEVVAIQGRLCEVVAIQGLDQLGVRLDQLGVHLDQLGVHLDLRHVHLDHRHVRVRLDRLDHVGEGRILSLRLSRLLPLQLSLDRPPPHLLQSLSRILQLLFQFRNLLQEHAPP